MRLHLLLSCAATGVALIMGAVSAGSTSSGAPRRAPVKSVAADPSLNRNVSRLWTNSSVEGVISDLASDTRSKFMLQVSIPDTSISGHIKQQPAVSVLRALERITGATWRSLGATWVLTDTPGLEQLLGLSLEDLGHRFGRATKPLLSLTPHQFAILRTRGRLVPADLNPGQRHSLLAVAQQEYVNGGGETGPEALQLEGVYLAYRVNPSNSVPPNEPWELALMFPRRDGEQLPPARSFPSSRVVISPRPSGIFEVPVPPTPLPTRKDLDLPEVTAVRENESPYANEPSCRLRIELPEISVLAAAAEVGRKAGLNLLVGGNLAERYLASAPDARQAREYLDQMAEITGGRWVRQNNIYVLEPAAYLERLSQLSTRVRERYCRELAVSWIGSLSRDQRATLEAGKNLRIAKLSKKQREHLRRIVALHIASRPTVTTKAIDLRNVHLSVGPARGTSTRPKLMLQLPVRAGTHPESGTVVLGHF